MNLTDKSNSHILTHIMIINIARLATIAREGIRMIMMVILGTATLSPAHITVIASDTKSQPGYRTAHLTVIANLGANPTVIT